MPQLLDSQISRALCEPAPWELAQWRAAALREKRDWEALLDRASTHLSDEMLRSADCEIRRERMWCGPAPASIGAAAHPTELARLEHYLARNLYSWLRPDKNTEVSSKVAQFTDKVALAAEGAVVANARLFSPSHAYSQATGTAQVAAITTSAAMNNREVAIFAGAAAYTSNGTAGSWKFRHSGAAVNEWWVYKRNAAGGSTHRFGITRPGSVPPGCAFYGLATNAVNLYIVNAADADVVLGVSPSSYILNTPTWFEWSYLNGRAPNEALGFLRTAAAFAQNDSAAPSSADPSGSLTIGASNTAGTSDALYADVADVLIANQISTTLQTIVRGRYLPLRYLMS